MPPRPRTPAVYIMASARNGTIYIGVTSNLPARAHQHRTACHPRLHPTLPLHRPRLLRTPPRHARRHHPGKTTKSRLPRPQTSPHRTSQPTPGATSTKKSSNPTPAPPHHRPPSLRGALSDEAIQNHPHPSNPSNIAHPKTTPLMRGTLKATLLPDHTPREPLRTKARGQDMQSKLERWRSAARDSQTRMNVLFCRMIRETPQA